MHVPAPAHRRDFLRWLLATPTLAGCVESTTESDEPDTSTLPTPPPAAPPLPGRRDEAPSVDVASTEEAATSCRLTSRDLEGPYFEAGAPRRTVLLAAPDEPGVRVVVQGTIVGGACNRPLAGYTLDLWQADAEGNYSSPARDGSTGGFRLRGKILTDAQGRYRFETILPGRYGDAAGIRPAHIHAKVRTPLGYELITTQLYFAGDPYLGSKDYCTRNGDCDSADVRRHLRLTDGASDGRTVKLTRFDYVLARS